MRLPEEERVFVEWALDPLAAADGGRRHPDPVGAAVVLPPRSGRPAAPTAAGMSIRSRGRLLSVESFRDVVGPLCRLSGERLSRALGVSEDLDTRLERIHSSSTSASSGCARSGERGGFALGCLRSLAAPSPRRGPSFVFSAPPWRSSSSRNRSPRRRSGACSSSCPCCPSSSPLWARPRAITRVRPTIARARPRRLPRAVPLGTTD